MMKRTVSTAFSAKAAGSGLKKNYLRVNQP
jgi:hypothetical protein